MDSSYPKAIAFVLKQEGGYSNDPQDPGGATNWGITIYDARKYWKSDATPSDVRAMPQQVARDIYQSKYWLVVAGPDLPAGLDLCTFDSAVNSGTGRANKWLASAIKVPLASYAVMAKQAIQVNQDEAIDRYCNTRLSFLHSLRTWSHFGAGWGRRVAELRSLSHVLWLQASGKSPTEVKQVIQNKVNDTKVAQNKDLPTTTTVTGGQVAAHYHFWHWDLLHVSIAAVGLLIALYMIRKCIQNVYQVKAYNDQILALSAVIPDAHV